MTVCRSCGATHPEGTLRCPRTRESVDFGPCGSRVDRYQVETLLGSGGFGGVYVALHTNLGQRVALKLLKPRAEVDPDIAERFLREARAAAAISSPHVVRVSDFGETASGEAFLVMELLAGRDLDAVLRASGPLSEPQAVALMLEVLAGLAAAHRAGVVHRDLKPANIFLAQDAGRQLAKLVDFGISHARLRPEDRTLTAAGMILGTPAYMAPEQLQGLPVDVRVDVYSAGVVLYQMLSGSLPHEAETFERLVVLLCTEDPRPIRFAAPQLTQALGEVVDRAVARQPSARFASVEAFAEALRAATGAHAGATPLAVAPASGFGPTALFQTPAGFHAASTPGGATRQDPSLVGGATRQDPSLVGSARPEPRALERERPRSSPVWPLLLVGGVGAAGLSIVALALIAAFALRGESPSSGEAPAAAAATLVVERAVGVSPPPLADAPLPVAPRPVALPLLVQRATGAAVHWAEPQTLGEGIDTAKVRALLAQIAPACDECRLPGRAAQVRVQVMLHPNGAASRVQASQAEQSDVEASACVANRFREAAGDSRLSTTSSIITLGAVLDPR